MEHEDAPPVCIARRKRQADPADGSTSDDEQVLDALDRQTADIETVEMARYCLEDVSTRQIDLLLSGCGERFHSLVFEDCAMCERFFAHTSQRLAGRGLELRYFRAARCVAPYKLHRVISNWPAEFLGRCRQAGMTTLVALTGMLTPSLEELELSSCALARQAAIILSQSLQTCRALRRLILSDNHLRDGGARAIADGLRALIALRSGHPASVLESSPSLPTPLTGLELLDMSRNSLSSTGFAALATVRTRTLLAAGNAIDSVPASLTRALAAMMLGGGELQVLDLSDNALSTEGVEELARMALQDRSSLRVLNLSGCTLTADAVESLQHCLLGFSHCPLQELTLGCQRDGGKEGGDNENNEPASLALMALKVAVEQTHLKLRVEILGGRDGKRSEVSAASPVSISQESTTHQCSPTDRLSPNETSSMTAPPVTTRPSTPPLVSIESIQPSVISSLEMKSTARDLRLRPADVEFIVSRTVESMNRSFDARIGQFLARLETQQHEKHASQLQFLLGKVEACERAIPRLEARLDVLSDRVATGSTQFAKLQSDLQTQLLTMRHEFDAKLTATTSSSALPSSSFVLPPPSTLLTSMMQTQVDELVAIRIRASEHKTLGELQKLRREAAAATATAAAAAAASSASAYPSPLPSPMSTASTAESQAAVLEAVSLHLTQFKRELDDKQSGTLRDFTESIVRDGLRLDDRMARLEAQVSTLEEVVQAEQQASLQALEAISEAFSDATTASPSPSPSPSTAQPLQRRLR